MVVIEEENEEENDAIGTSEEQGVTVAKFDLLETNYGKWRLMYFVINLYFFFL